MEHRHQPKQGDQHHEHGVGKSHNHVSHKPKERKRLLITIILTGSMMIAEVIGGIIANSLALLSDAGHMLTHFFALGISLFAILLASRPAAKERSFGFYRAEILAAFINGVTLVIITAYIFWEAYKRILAPQPIAEMEMFIVAILGLIVNLASAFILSGLGKEDLNIRSAFLHMLGDTASSVGVVIGAIVIFYTGWFIIDPLLSLLIGVVIFIWALRLLIDSVNVLLESTPKHINVDDLTRRLKERFDQIEDVHDVHIWEITSKMYSMTAHVRTGDMRISETNILLEQINEMLDKEFDIGHTIIQFECGRVSIAGG